MFKYLESYIDLVILKANIFYDGKFVYGHFLVLVLFMQSPFNLDLKKIAKMHSVCVILGCYLYRIFFCSIFVILNQQLSLHV